MNTIYSNNPFVTGAAYSQYDYVKYDGTFAGNLLTGAFLYCVADHTASTSITESYWNGITKINGNVYPKFIWEPDYNNTVEIAPKSTKINFGDGYEVRVRNGINNILNTYNLTFSKRKLDETTAILHFLNQQAGVDPFVFEGRRPFVYSKLFICENWQNTEIFANNYTITCQFREVAN